MPTSLMASIDLDASGFNRKATEVIAKSKQIGKQVTEQASRTITGVDTRRGAGLASDPVAFMSGEAREKEMARRRASTMAAHEAWLARKNAATKAAADKEKSIFGGLDRRNAKLQAEVELYRQMGRVHPSQYTKDYAAALEKHARGSDRAARSSSALGGAVKMFAGYMTVDFLQRQAREVIQFGSHVSDLADRLGISTTAIQQWDFAAKQNGATIDDVARFFQNLAKRREKALEGNDEAISDFKRFGVTLDDLKNKRFEDIGLQIHRAFKAGDPQKMLSDLQQIGGRGAATLATMFASDMEGLFSQATIIPPDTIEKLDEIDDRFAEIAANFKSGLAQAVVFLVDAVSGAVEIFRTVAAGVIGFVQGSFAEAFKSGSIIGALTSIVGVVDAGLEKSAETVFDYKQGRKLEQEEKDARKKKTKFVGGGDDIEAGEGDVKGGGKNAEREAERLERLREALTKKEADLDLIGLKPEERKAELLQRRSALVEKISKASQEEDRIKLKGELVDLDKAIARDDEATAKKKERLQQSLARKHEDNILAQLDEDQKIRSLQNEMARLEEDARAARMKGDEIAALEAENKLADTGKQLLSLTKKEEEDTARRNRLQGSTTNQLGGFLGTYGASLAMSGPEAAAQNTRLRMEQHLASINRGIALLTGNRSSPNPDEEY
jgi:hypothetical protein